MAAFSSAQPQPQPFLLDSLFQPNTPSTANCFPQFYQTQNQINANDEVPLVINSMDSSSIVTDKFDTKPITPSDKKRKPRHPSSATSKDKREVKEKKQKKSKDGDEEKNIEAPTGYIHVRARRGQATDSHSIAERVRRERISERMKLLQGLVPGCDKVTGKALMLDEIINYVQSLQNQVEFLSMKLASANPMFYDFGMDLESFMVRPDEDTSSMQECSTTRGNNSNFQENCGVFQQSQNPNVLQVQAQQGSRQSLWEVDELIRQKIINQSGFSNNLLSFH